MLDTDDRNILDMCIVFVCIMHMIIYIYIYQKKCSKMGLPNFIPTDWFFKDLQSGDSFTLSYDPFLISLFTIITQDIVVESILSRRRIWGVLKFCYPPSHQAFQYSVMVIHDNWKMCGTLMPQETSVYRFTKAKQKKIPKQKAMAIDCDFACSLPNGHIRRYLPDKIATTKSDITYQAEIV